MGLIGRNLLVRANYKPLSLFLLVILLLNAAEGQEIVSCLTSCGQAVIFCALGCAASPGDDVVSCYEGCGSANMDCVKSCLGTSLLSSRVKHQTVGVLWSNV